MYQVAEHDEFDLVVAFRTSAGTLSAPSSIAYRVDAADGTAIVASTSVSAASSVTITLGYAANAIVDSTKEFEDHVVTVIANFGTDGSGNARQVTKQWQYQVRNLAVLS